MLTLLVFPLIPLAKKDDHREDQSTAVAATSNATPLRSGTVYVNALASGFFSSQDPPARSTVAASGLAVGARVEIECIAVAG